MSEESKSPQSANVASGLKGKYEEDAIYQDGKVVGWAVEPEIRWDAREIYFAEINRSDDLMLPEECEFQKYRLMIRRIEYASRIDRNAPGNGRVLRGVVAEILGYREV